MSQLGNYTRHGGNREKIGTHVLYPYKKWPFLCMGTLPCLVYGRYKCHHTCLWDKHVYLRHWINRGIILITSRATPPLPFLGQPFQWVILKIQTSIPHRLCSLLCWNLLGPSPVILDCDNRGSPWVHIEETRAKFASDDNAVTGVIQRLVPDRSQVHGIIDRRQSTAKKKLRLDELKRGCCCPVIYKSALCLSLPIK